MNQLRAISVAILVIGVCIDNIYAADIAAGQSKSAACVACHGVKGISAVPFIPNLASQKGAYLEKQLKAFREGSRQDPVMGSIAKSLTDDDIVNLAAYFSSL